MSKHVIAVRQDVTLLVDGGQAVAGLNPYDVSVFGLTLGGIPNVWRAGVGVTANGAIVYVYGPDMEVTQLAALLVRARAVRAMTLDINPDWTVFVTYKAPPGAPASPRTGVHCSLAPSRARRPSSSLRGPVTSLPCPPAGHDDGCRRPDEPSCRDNLLPARPRGSSYWRDF